MKCGLLGEKLSHSYSPMLHTYFGEYEYALYERSPEQVGNFLLNGQWDALNVTIPYKKTVIPYVSELSDTAKQLGSVNTILRRNGKLYGENTDADGFLYMVRQSGISVQHKKVLVLGSGGASVTVCAMLKRLRAGEIIVISRSGADNYRNISKHNDAGIIVNATPVGMYPNNGVSPICLADFPKCKGVLDLIYNPAKTELLLQAEKLRIPHANGLSMLVAQAKRSSELFTGHPIADSEILRVQNILQSNLRNIILIGMPGCGKSSVAKILSETLRRPIVETDAYFPSIPEIFASHGEAYFRRLETNVLADVGKQSGIIISTGGGCVTREENYPLLHQNGVIVWIQRPIECLPSAGRPLSEQYGTQFLYEQRKTLYARFADVIVQNDISAEHTASEIIRILYQ